MLVVMPLDAQLKQLRSRLAHAAIVSENISETALMVKAVNREVGDIVIRTDGGEVTVSLGDHFHQHFDSSPTLAERTSDVLQFILDFVTGRSVLTITYVGTRRTTARLANPGTGQSTVIAYAMEERDSTSGARPSSANSTSQSTRSFKWTGPVSADVPPPLDDATSKLAQRLSQLTVDDMKQLADELARRFKEGKNEPENG